MAELSKKTISLIDFYSKKEVLKQGEKTIHVDEFASKVAAFYEKIRTVVDWKEEHLMRRSAIIRKIKRRFLEDKQEMAEPLISELVRGGHFPNDKIEEIKIAEVQQVINKYIFILHNLPPSKDKTQLYNWLLEIAACEIEEILAPFEKERSLINYMFDSMREKIVLNEGAIALKGITEEEKNTLIYIAVQKSLFKLDPPIICYNILKYRYPQWEKPTQEWLLDIAKNIYRIWHNLEKKLSHPLGKKFYVICEKYDTPYLLLGDILKDQENFKKIEDPEALEALVKKAYNKRLSTLKARLFRAAVYSTVSIFLTKCLTLILIEVAIAKMTGEFTMLTVIANVLAPTLLMFLLTATITLPSKNNLQTVVMETMKIIYHREKIETYEIKTLKRKGIVITFFVSLFYLIGTIISFGLMVWILRLIHLPFVSIIINIIFVALIAFAGLAVRRRAEELTMEERLGGLGGFIFDILFLPIASLGRWLSNKWKKYNAIAAFFNAMIDMPFSVFVEFLERWRFFLKEKREEIH